MNHSTKVGFSFGLTSGIITTLGLMVGLSSGTNSKLAVLGGILTIAIADAFSDALGIHVSEESENKHTTSEIWQATISTFITKFIIALTFVVPVLFFKLGTAVMVSVIWGLLLLGVSNYFMSDGKNMPRWKVVMEHLFIAVVVIVVTHYVGVLVGSYFG